jgi:hypothetical protein
MSFGSTFLRSPDLCPARRSGESWGDYDLTLSLAEEEVSLLGLSRVQHDALTQRCPDWTCSHQPQTPQVAIRVFRARQDDFNELDTRGWEYTLEMEFMPDAVRCVGLDFVGALDWREGKIGGAIWTFRDGRDDLTGAFANFLRLVATYRLAERGGLVLHSAGIHRSGGAIVGYGRSGAGKTTFTRLCCGAGFGIISDDLLSLFITDDGVEVRALPFSGELGPDHEGKKPMPLKKLCRLVKGECEQLEPMGLSQGVASLLACSPAINNDPYRSTMVQDVITGIVARVAPQTLVFSREGQPWTILET